MKKQCIKKSPAGGVEEKAKPPVEGSTLVTVGELARRYRVSPRMIFNWIAERRVGCYRLGRTLRFHPAECDQDIRKFRIPARQ